MTMIETIQQNAKTAWWVGLLLVVVGVLSVLAPLAAGISVAIVVGVFLLVGGVAELVLVFQAGSFGKALGVVLIGALNVIAGVYMIAQPAKGLLALTVFLAIYFALTGITEIVGAFQARPQNGWGWLAFAGALSLVLGIMIWRQLPLSGVWAVGVLVGVRLISNGSTLLAVGRVAGDAAEDATELAA